MRKAFTKDFMRYYDQAFNLYIKGRWLEAKEEFEKVFEIRPDDPLSMRLVEYMAGMNFKAPNDWKGYKFFQE